MDLLCEKIDQIYENQLIATRMAAYDMSQLEHRNTYGDNIISGNAQVHQGDVYITKYYNYRSDGRTATSRNSTDDADMPVPTEQNVQRDARDSHFEELLMNSS